MKMDIRCDQGVFAGLFVVNDWDLLVATSSVTTADFEAARGRLRGFSEVSKTYTTEQLQLQALEDEVDVEREIIRRIQRECNFALVQGAGVQEIMLAASLRKGGAVDEKVLLTILTQGYVFLSFLTIVLLFF